MVNKDFHKSVVLLLVIVNEASELLFSFPFWVSKTSLLVTQHSARAS